MSSNKPLLVFKHNPKAAGGTLRDLFIELKPNRIDSVTTATAYNHVVNGDVKDVDPDSSYVLVYEDQWLNPILQQRGFVISSIREPCSHMISLWSYGSAGHGGFYHKMLTDDPEFAENAYGKDAPLYSSESDMKRFRNIYMARENIRSFDFQRFTNSYLKPSESEKKPHAPAVDCWVYTENFAESTVSCLKQFERQGGSVNWDAPMAKELLVAATKKRHLNAGKNGVESNEASHHSSCHSYYDEQTAASMEIHTAMTYKMFGYEACCEKSFNFQTNITANFINLEREQDIAKVDRSKKSSSEGRKLLVFKSNRGIDSSPILNVLNEIKPVEMSRDSFTQDAYYNSGVGSEDSVTDKFVHFQDHESLATADQKHGFVISVIREPCSHFVAEFRSGSKGKGDVRAYWDRYSPEWTKEAYGQDAPRFDSDADVDRFRNIWYPKNEGLIGNYFKQNYLQGGDNEKAPVDCWVHLEAFEASMLSCFQQFEEQGGTVDWNKPLMLEMVDTVEKMQQQNLAKLDDDTLLCSKFFDNDISVLIAKGKESFMYDAFVGYDKCCEGHKVVSALDLNEIISKQGDYLEGRQPLNGDKSVQVTSKKNEWNNSSSLVASVLFVGFLIASLFTFLRKMKRNDIRKVSDDETTPFRIELDEE